MPVYLRHDALRLLESGVEAYLLALCGASLPNLRQRRVPESQFSPVVGLLGTSVELIVKACLVQAFGVDILLREDRSYIGALEALRTFRQQIHTDQDELQFLWRGFPERDTARDRLLTYLRKFDLLMHLRSAGLHGGRGPSRDVVLLQVRDVYEFIHLLSHCRRLRPYLRHVPEPAEPVVSRSALVEDLARRSINPENPEEMATVVTSIFLVLPTVPDEEPEWLAAFQRLTISPQEDDLRYLVTVLEEAHGVHLFRHRGNGEGLPVRVAQGDPQAIPVSLQFFKREFTKIPEQFDADVATANGRLLSGILDLPPDDFVLGLFGLGIENSPLSQRLPLAAQQVWPFVATALSGPGTPKPFWFLVHVCNEVSALEARLRDIADKGNAYLRNRLPPILDAIRAKASGATLPNSHPLQNEISALYTKWKNTKADIREALQRCMETPRYPPNHIIQRLERIIDGEEGISGLLRDLLKADLQDIDIPWWRYWVRLLTEAATYDDREALLAVLKERRAETYAWTHARKQLWLWDVFKFGPAITVDS